MRVLQICHKPPFPAKDGGCLAMHNMSLGFLEKGLRLKILTVSTHKHPLEVEELDDDYLVNTRIEDVFIDTRVNLMDAFSTIITSDSYNVSRFFSTDFDIKLIEILKKENFDYIQLESLYMTPYIDSIRKYSSAKVVMRSHNVEFQVWSRLKENATSFLKKKYLGYLTKKLKQYEISVLNRMDGIVCITEEDKKNYKKLGAEIPMIEIPFGVNLDDYAQVKVATKKRLKFYHLGAMDWQPNIEGIHWFAKEIWQKIGDKDHVEFRLAGKNISSDFNNYNTTSWKTVGTVPNAIDFIKEQQILVVPLLSGGGMRVKVIEAMALGKLVISTPIGVEGIPAKHAEEVFIFETAEEFKRLIDLLKEKPFLVDEIGKNAREFVKENFAYEILTDRLLRFYSSLS